MGLRLLFFILALFIIWQIARHLIASRNQSEKLNSKKQKTVKSDKMVACRQCGLHIPQDEAIISQGKAFCSDEHARLYNKKS